VIPPANERKKLIPLAMMFFCILFNYTILRDTKVRSHFDSIRLI
jgi:AAA family ATP:ADP antiporter